MPILTVPLLERNDCHDPKTGRFAPKGTGNCGPGAQTASKGIDQGKLRQLLDKAPAAQDELTWGLGLAVKQLGGQTVDYFSTWKGRGARAALGPIKTEQRITEKALSDYGGDVTQVRDIVRASIAVDGPDGIGAAIDAVHKNFVVVREKNRFANPISGGYRDYLANVRFRNGLIGEIQIHVKPLLEAKETKGHKLYEAMRKLVHDTSDSAKQELKRLHRESMLLYRSAWLAAATVGGRWVSESAHALLRLGRPYIPRPRERLGRDGDSAGRGVGAVPGRRSARAFRGPARRDSADDGEAVVEHGDPDRPGPYPHGRGGVAQRPTRGRPVPVRVKTVSEAVKYILAGRVVELRSTSQVNTLLSRLAQMAVDAEARGEKAPYYDLCKVSVRGTNLFCVEKLRTKEFPNGVPRIEMPQFKGFPEKGTPADRLPKDEKGMVDGAEHFIAHLKSLGIRTTDVEVPAARLKATQSELVGPTVAGMMASKTYNPAKGRIFTSRDGYILDGHHRWAAVVGRDAKRGRLGNLTMHTTQVDAPVSEVLFIARQWVNAFGIAERGSGAAAVHRVH